MPALRHAQRWRGTLFATVQGPGGLGSRLGVGDVAGDGGGCWGLLCHCLSAADLMQWFAFLF